MVRERFVQCLTRSLSKGELSSEKNASGARPVSETTPSSFDSLVGEQLMPMSAISGRGEEASAAMAASKKRVMVVIDALPESQQAMLWALSHIVHSSDILSLMHFQQTLRQKTPEPTFSRPKSERLHSFQERLACSATGEKDPLDFCKSFKMLCTARRPEVEVEVMTVEGMDKALTIVTQAKKLEANVLVLGQRKPSLFQRVFHHRSSHDEVIDYCIQNSECLTLAVRKKSRHMHGYLINSRWQKNFWLLA